MLNTLLAGLTVLVIGDSHMASNNYLISTLHDDLMERGAVVYSYGSCGSSAGAWVRKTHSICGGAQRIKDGEVVKDNPAEATTRPIAELVNTHKPNLIVVVNGDTMGAYNNPTMPKTWIWQEVTSLTKAIKKTGVACAWVGPPWGAEGGEYGKTFARVKELSSYLSGIVAPCTYIDSSAMAKPGEWRSTDGQHFSSSGYRYWGKAIGEAVSAPAVLATVKK